MKKLYFLGLAAILFLAAHTDSNAQRIDDRLELGIRLNVGDDNPFEAAFDGIWNVSSSRRFHGNLGIGDGGIGVDLIHDWIFTFNGDGRLVFYPGVGGSVYFLSDDVFIGVTGEIGLEYRFDIPITLGLDYRPTFFILPETDLASNGVGINVRWRF